MSKRMEKLLTPEELAAILCLSVQTVYNRRSNGDDLPPAVHIGRLVRYRVSDVDAWIGTLSRHPVTAETHKTGRCGEEPMPRGRPTKAEQVRRRRQQHH